MEQVKKTIKELSGKNVKIIKVNNLNDFIFYVKYAIEKMDKKYYLFEKNSKNEKFVNFKGQQYYVLYNDNFVVFTTFTKSITNTFKNNLSSSCCICDVITDKMDDKNFMNNCDVCSATFCNSNPHPLLSVPRFR